MARAKEDEAIILTFPSERRNSTCCTQCGTDLAPNAKFCHACGFAAFSQSRPFSSLSPSVVKAATVPTDSTQKPSRWSAWSLKVSTEEQARKAIRESAVGFYAVAGIQALASLFLGASVLIDAALFAGLGLWLHRKGSKVAATLLAILAAITIGTTFWNQVTGAFGGRNIVFSLIVFWAAVRAVIATYKHPALATRDGKLEVAG
jgi:zinc-ribbon domain